MKPGFLAAATGERILGRNPERVSFLEANNCQPTGESASTEERNDTMKNANLKSKARLLEQVRLRIASSMLTLLALLLPTLLMAAPIIVAINDVPNGPPSIQVLGAPNGYDIYRGDCVADPSLEDGALITLFGVDTSGTIPDWGGRFVVPNAPNQCRAGVDIVWVQHDNLFSCDLFGNNDLQVGFNSANAGVFYRTPTPGPSECLLSADVNLGGVTDKWVLVYASEQLVILVNPHTYRLRK